MNKCLQAAAAAASIPSCLQTYPSRVSKQLLEDGSAGPLPLHAGFADCNRKAIYAIDISRNTWNSRGAAWVGQQQRVHASQ